MQLNSTANATGEMPPLEFFMNQNGTNGTNGTRGMPPPPFFFMPPPPGYFLANHSRS